MMLLFISYLINILFLNLNNPMILGILLFLQTIILILMMGKIFYSFWFSYIIFLVFIGGLFILFIYMISLTYNNKFFLPKKYFLSFMIFLLFLKYKLWFMNNHEMSLNEFLLINKENSLNSIKLYNFPNSLINIMLIIYLFLLMIIVVKITNFFLGPIRIN